MHTAYTFVSRSQGFTARSSQVVSLPASSEQAVSMRVEEGAALDYNRNYSLDGQGPDCEIEPEVINSNRRKRDIGVSIFQRLSSQNYYV